MLFGSVHPHRDEGDIDVYIFWVDPVEDLFVVSMIQLMGSPWPLRNELQVLTYQALTELNGR